MLHWRNNGAAAPCERQEGLLGNPDACDSSSARHPENQGRPNDGVGESPPHEAARSLRLHWPPAAGHSAKPVGHRATSAFWSAPPSELWLCFRPSASADSDLNSCDSRPCFDPKLALFGAFWGLVMSSGRHCPTPSPCAGWPAACAPSWDKIPFLSVSNSERGYHVFSDVGTKLEFVGFNEAVHVRVATDIFSRIGLTRCLSDPYIPSAG